MSELATRSIYIDNAEVIQNVRGCYPEYEFNIIICLIHIIFLNVNGVYYRLYRFKVRVS